MRRPSAHYRRCLEEAKRHHASSKTYSGKFLRPRGDQIKEILDRLGCRSALDYGCGKGRQYEWVNPGTGQTLEQYWGIPVTKYDPAWPPFEAPPIGTFDLVICTHVLGSIPRTDLPWVIDLLHFYAKKAIFVAEQIGVSRKEVFTERTVLPVGYTAAKWADMLRRPGGGKEVHLLTRERTPAGTFVRTEIL